MADFKLSDSLSAQLRGFEPTALYYCRSSGQSDLHHRAGQPRERKVNPVMNVCRRRRVYFDVASLFGVVHDSESDCRHLPWLSPAVL